MKTDQRSYITCLRLHRSEKQVYSLHSGETREFQCKLNSSPCSLTAPPRKPGTALSPTAREHLLPLDHFFW